MQHVPVEGPGPNSFLDINIAGMCKGFSAYSVDEWSQVNMQIYNNRIILIEYISADHVW